MRRALHAFWTLGLFVWADVGWAFAHAEIGSVIENVALPALAGGRRPLLTNATANVFIFFKAGQEHSRAALKQMALCQRELAAKPVHWVAIMSDRDSKTDAEADVKESGLAMPVLIDVGDALYGKLGVGLHPVVGITDKDHKLVAYQPFSKVNYQEVIRTRVRHLLGEITDQELDQALHPDSPTQGGDAEIARRCLKLAERQLQAGNYDKALGNVAKSIGKDPGIAAAYVLLGRIRAAQGNHAEALKAFEQALKLDPASTDAIEGHKASQEKVR